MLALCLAAGARAEDKVLNIYNWSDYIARDTIRTFERETGIKVHYDVYDSNETLQAKLMSGNSGYDLVFPSASPNFAQMLQAGVFREIDKSRLKGWKDLDPAVLKILAGIDPDNRHGVPYTVAETGFGYNVEAIKARMPDAPVDSWAMLFDPAVVAKFKDCGVTFLDTPTEVFPAALVHKGRKGDSLSREDLQLAAAAAAAVRPFVKYFHSSSYINDLANGDICLAHGYIGDLVQARNRAREAGKGVEIGISTPKEGAVLDIDVMAIPADAPHPDNALAFIDFLLRPRQIAAITNETGYANAVLTATPQVAPAIRQDPVIYPPPSVRAKGFMLPVTDLAYERARTRAWTRVKTGE